MFGPPPNLHLPWDRWPQVDRQLWTAATACDDDPFADAAGARLAPATLKRYWFGWRRLLGWLSIEDPTALDLDVADRLTPERIKQFATHLALTNKPHSVALAAQAVYHAARLMMPKESWGWFAEIVNRLFQAAPSARRKGPVVTSVALLRLGLKLMEGAGANGFARLKDAVQYRDGLIIALLSFVPLRRKNLAALELERHVVRVGENWTIVIPAEESKTKTFIDFELPAIVVAHLQVYLAEARPRLLKRATSRNLWISAKGNALCYDAFWNLIGRHTSKGLGIRLSPHDARDAAVTMWAIEVPSHVGIGRDLLAHSDLRAGTKHYNRARGIEASRAHHRLVGRLRRRSSAVARGRKPHTSFD